MLTDGGNKYVWGLGLAYTVDQQDTAQVLHTDGLGSVRARTDSAGSIVETYETDPFGVATVGTLSQPFQFTGEQSGTPRGCTTCGHATMTQELADS